jgi:hypothetical protein
VATSDSTGTGPAPAPILVLGSHRSGMSAVMGLFVTAAGLEVGDVMPPSRANLKGWFESVAIAKAHNDILACLDRDWTCPPATFDPDDVPTAGIAAEIAFLAESGGAWGVKDPRLLYMLPAWIELLPAMSFVGVVRDHEDVVRSLQARDRLDGGVADMISRAYTRRLRVLRDHVEFPLIDVSLEPDDVLNQTKAAALTLGLKWDGAAAARFFDPAMLKRRSHGTLTNDDVDALRAQRDDIESSSPVTSEALRPVVAEFARLEDHFDRYSGPRSVARRTACWRAVPNVGAGVELSRNLKVTDASSPIPDGGRAIQCRDLDGLYVTLRTLARAPDAVVLPDLTSWLRRDELVAAFSLLHGRLEVDGVVVVGCSEADADTQKSLGRSPITADELRAAAIACGFVELPTASDWHMTTLRFVAVAPAGMTRSSPSPPPSVITIVPDRRTTLAHVEPDWKAMYERLRARRSVRVALASAALWRPLFRFVRLVRKRPRRDG